LQNNRTGELSKRAKAGKRLCKQFKLYWEVGGRRLDFARLLSSACLTNAFPNPSHIWCPRQ
jgi:hypothetical protein